MKKKLASSIVILSVLILSVFIFNPLGEVTTVSKIFGESCKEKYINNKRVKPENFKNELEFTNLFDGAIPEIKNPKFIKYDPSLPNVQGIGIEQNGVAKFYPFNILVWHSILNDCINNTPVLITFCPICQIGIVYNRQVGDSVLDFTMGKEIWLESLLAIDNQTKSKWSLVLGESIEGTYEGLVLQKYPSTTTSLQQWVAIHPDTLILSENTGFAIPYSADYSLDKFNRSDPIFDVKKTFVLVLNDSPEIMYILQKAGTEIIDNETKIKFLNDKIEISRFNKNIDDYIIAPWYLWVSAYPEARVSEKTI